LTDLNDFYDPDFYDLKIGPGSRVADIYLPLINNPSGNVLELGCGTGDVLIPIARTGVSCWGIDVVDSMLEKCRENLNREKKRIQNSVTLENADIKAFKLNEFFKYILMTNDIIAHLHTNEELLSCLSTSLDHLGPQGKLIFDISVFDLDYLAFAADPLNWTLRHRGNGVYDETHTVDVWERTQFDNLTGLLEAHFRYDILNKGGDITRSFNRKLVLKPRRLDEVKLALMAANFKIESVHRLERSPGDSAFLITAVPTNQSISIQNRGT